MPSNEGGDLGIDGRVASDGLSREVGPILAEVAALPADLFVDLAKCEKD
jgi:hypothetical protein